MIKVVSALTARTQLGAIMRRATENQERFICAVEANASHLVTGNTRHFPHEIRTIRVVTPREFFALLLERLAP